MAESKRLQLDPPTPLQKEKKIKDLKPTVRFDLQLERECDSLGNQFSYRDLLQQAEAKDENFIEKQDFLFVDDDDDDDKLQEIARKLEEKYNPKPGRRKRKKGVICEDYVDRGMGYDETDPFIDNGEAYDELVPSTLTTEFGGFYVNKGPLEFKNIAEESIGDPKTKKKRKKKEDKDMKKKRRTGAEEENPKKRGRKPAIQIMSALPKPKKKTQPTVADMLQHQKAHLQQQQQEKLQQIQTAPIVVERNLVEVPEVKVESSEYLPVTVHGANSTIWDAIESVVKASAEEAASNGSAGVVTGSSDGEEITSKPGIETIAPKLPENLPPDLDSLVEKLKEAAYNSEEGKCKFFSSDVNHMLLSVELKSQELTSAQRSTIYSHLASHLPCTKETLQKRAKKLRLDQEDNKLREPMQKLKDAITAAMPDMLERYEALLKSPSEVKEKPGELEMPPMTDEETDDEEERNSGLPKKVFEWNDITRKYLCDVVRIKLKCYEVAKTRMQSAEEYLKSFFRAEVKPLWPKGWMYARTLLKESREAHSSVTNRPKRALMMPKKSVSPAVMCLKLANQTTNSALPQESNVESLQPERCVPSDPLLYDVDRKCDVPKPVCVDGLKHSDIIKLLTYPLKTPLESPVLSQVSPSASSAVNTLNEPTTLKLNPSTSSQVKAVSESPLVKAQSPTKQSTVSPVKPSEVNNYTDGSLAHDMLAYIIRASLADFPYAGSSCSENIVSKNKSVITSSPSLMHGKESRSANSKLVTDSSYTSLKRSDDGKPIKLEIRKPSQDIGSHILLSGGTVESLLNTPLSSQPNDICSPTLRIKNKEVVKAPVNMKLREVMDSRQFAEAFERTEPVSSRKPTAKHQISKIPNSLGRTFPVTSTSLSLEITKEGMAESSISASPRTIVENTQMVSQDLASKLNICPVSQGLSQAPYKKRTKYTQSNKTSDSWNHYLDTVSNPSILEGMKGFPFPVSTPPPTPPPAHCSAAIKSASQIKDNPYVLHSQQSPRSNSLAREMKTSYSRVGESSNHSQQQQILRLPVVEPMRRQSLIKGPWNSCSVSQSSPTSHSQYHANSQTSLTSPLSTSPSICSPSMHQNPTIVYAHSQSASVSEKSFHNQSQLAVHVSHPPTQGHTPRTSPSVHLLHINEGSYLVHQPSHSVSSHQPPAHSRSNTPFVHTHPSTSSSSLSGTFSQELKTTPRPK